MSPRPGDPRINRTSLEGHIRFAKSSKRFSRSSLSPGHVGAGDAAPRRQPLDANALEPSVGKRRLPNLQVLCRVGQHPDLRRQPPGHPSAVSRMARCSAISPLFAGHIVHLLRACHRSSVEAIVDADSCFTRIWLPAGKKSHGTPSFPRVVSLEVTADRKQRVRGLGIGGRSPWGSLVGARTHCSPSAVQPGARHPRWGEPHPSFTASAQRRAWRGRYRRDTTFQNPTAATALQSRGSLPACRQCQSSDPRAAGG
jgi:hypothetical protein